MNPEVQTVLALAAVTIAVAAFVWRAVARRGRSGCGEACGCPSQKLKAQSKI